MRLTTDDLINIKAPHTEGAYDYAQLSGDDANEPSGLDRTVSGAGLGRFVVGQSWRRFSIDAPTQV
jgi:hypothetical protein